MAEKQCRECDHFIDIFGSQEGGGERCPHDATPDRKTIYARDHACDNFKGRLPPPEIKEEEQS
jgi:hypothetical protein